MNRQVLEGGGTGQTGRQHPFSRLSPGPGLHPLGGALRAVTGPPTLVSERLQLPVAMGAGPMWAGHPHPGRLHTGQARGLSWVNHPSAGGEPGSRAPRWRKDPALRHSAGACPPTPASPPSQGHLGGSPPAGVAVPAHPHPPNSTQASITFRVSMSHASVAGPCFYLLCLATLPTPRQPAVWARAGAGQVGWAIRQGASLRSLACSCASPSKHR